MNCKRKPYVPIFKCRSIQYKIEQNMNHYKEYDNYYFISHISQITNVYVEMFKKFALNVLATC